jgi:cysteinyl-tRNA synthetase
MSMKYLGRTLDIHGGGLDLQFPHHENELAQSESYTGQEFAKFWMHNGLLKMGTTKMAGSVGNVVNIADLLERHHPETVRFLLLSTHYRSPIEYSEERLNEIRRSLEGFYRFFERYQRITGRSFYTIEAPRSAAEHEALQRQYGDENLEGEEALKAFHALMEDDFNTGGAVAQLFELLKHLNRLADEYQLEGPIETTYRANFERGAVVLKEMGQVLGLFREPVASGKAGNEQLLGGLRQLLRDLGAEARAGDGADLDGLMRLFISLRAEARKKKDFATADQVRKRLGELGVTLEDRPGGTGWRMS